MKRKLLMIEDDQVLRETTAAFLEAEGFVVKTAADGKTGFELASKEKADLIVTDLMLPGLNGLEICRKLREKGIGTPVIMLTGQKKDEIDKVVGLELGADDYLTKPFGQRELLARINAVLRRSMPEPKDIEECLTTNILFIILKSGEGNMREREYFLAALQLIFFPGHFAGPVRAYLLSAAGRTGSKAPYFVQGAIFNDSSGLSSG